MEYVPHVNLLHLYTTPVEGILTADYTGPYVIVNRPPGVQLTLDNFLQLGDRPFMFTRAQFGGLQLQPISYVQLVFNNCNGWEWRCAQLASVFALNYLITIHEDWANRAMVLDLIKDAKLAIRDLENCDMRIVRDYCLNDSLGDLLIMSALLCGVPNSVDYQKIAMLQLNYIRAQAVAKFYDVEIEVEHTDEADDEDD